MHLGRFLLLGFLAAGLGACSSPEATRTRGGSPGADVRNVGSVVQMHGDSRPFYGTPYLGVPGRPSKPAGWDWHAIWESAKTAGEFVASIGGLWAFFKGLYDLNWERRVRRAYARVREWFERERVGLHGGKVIRLEQLERKFPREDPEIRRACYDRAKHDGELWLNEDRDEWVLRP